MKKFKKVISVMLASALVAGCVAGCGGKKNNDSASEGGANNIQISVWNAGMGTDWLDNVIEGFEAKYPEYNVTYTASASQDSVNAAFGFPETDRNDLYLSVLKDMPEYLEPLNDILDTTVEGESKTIREKFNAKYLADEERDGKYYSLTMGGGIVGVVYNTEMLANMGITQEPRTTNELVQIAFLSSDQGTPAFCHFKPGGYWNWMANLWASQYDGYEYYSETLYKNPTKEVLLTKDGRYEALKVIEQLVTDQTTLQGSNSDSHITMQTKFFSDKCAMMVNGSWLINEMPGDIEGMDRFVMMKTPVISSITQKLSTIKSETLLRDVITAIDEVTEGTKALSDYQDGDGYVVAGEKVSAEDWDRVASARNSYASAYAGNAAFIPNYSDAIDGAKLFLTYLYSDEGYTRFMDTTHMMLPLTLDSGEVDMSDWKVFEKNQAELLATCDHFVSEFISAKSRIYIDGGATIYGGVTYIPYLCTNSAADKRSADQIWEEVTQKIEDNYDNWVKDAK